MNKKKRGESRKYKYSVIFTYSTKHLRKKDKIRFYYALKGRDGKTGIIKRYKIEQLGRTVLLVSSKHEKQIQEFLTFWKCKYQKKIVLVDEKSITKNFVSNCIFTYSTKHLLKKDKIRFYYALKGRDGKSGIAKKYKIKQLGRAVLMINSRFENHLKEFLSLWKCKFKKRRVLVEK